VCGVLACARACVKRQKREDWGLLEELRWDGLGSASFSLGFGIGFGGIVYYFIVLY
jgi:hypothetical protein